MAPREMAMLHLAAMLGQAVGPAELTGVLAARSAPAGAPLGLAAGGAGAGGGRKHGREAGWAEREVRTYFSPSRVGLCEQGLETYAAQRRCGR